MKKLLFIFLILFIVLAGCTDDVEGQTTESAIRETEGATVEPTIEPTAEEDERPTEVVLTLSYPDSDLLESGDYHYCLCGDKEYAVQVVLSVDHKVSDLTISSVVLTDEGDELIPVVRFDEFAPETPIVADLSFPGDMSAYAVSFVAEGDVVYVYSIYQSGMDGSIILTDYVPFIV